MLKRRYEISRDVEKLRPEALICANDLMAIGAMDAARDEFGLTIPDDP